MRLVFISFLAFFMSACSASLLPYDLNNPEATVKLPTILDEVSGLSDVDMNHIACVQDEKGRIYIVSIQNGSIIDEIDFTSEGDFEGLTYLDSMFYVLRSDGTLYVISGALSGGTQTEIFNLELKSKDNEGFAFDPIDNQFLIAAKSKNIGEKENRMRAVYALNRSTYQLESKAALLIDTDQLGEYAEKNGIQQQNYTIKGKEKAFSFRPSSIAVHPKSGDYYIISAEDFLLIVMNRKEEILMMEVLDSQIFPKAEGITFLPDGTMIITNESAGSGATLLRFNELRKKSKHAN